MKTDCVFSNCSNLLYSVLGVYTLNIYLQRKLMSVCYHINTSLSESFKSTDPSSLTIHMNAPDMFCQIRTGVETLWTEVPAAGISYCLRPRGAGTALSIHHSWSGASAGHCALHFHQGTVDTERRERAQWVEREEEYSFTVIKHGR